MLFNHFVEFLFKLKLWFFISYCLLLVICWFIHIYSWFCLFWRLFHWFIYRAWLYFYFLRLIEWSYLNSGSSLHGNTFEKFIGINFTLFKFLYFLEHLSFLFFYLLFHELPLIKKLLSLVFDKISFEHFLLYFLE